MRKSFVVTAFSIAGPLAVAALMHAGLLGPATGLAAVGHGGIRRRMGRS